MPHERLDMQDPRKQYPQPPFKPQHQSQPGLAKDMSPQPDNGEASYIGSGKLKGRKALITGADSGIGRAVAIAFARKARTWRSATCPVRQRTPKPCCSKLRLRA